MQLGALRGDGIRYSASSTPECSDSDLDIPVVGSDTPVDLARPDETSSWVDDASDAISDDEANVGPDFQAVIPQLQPLGSLPHAFPLLALMHTLHRHERPGAQWHARLGAWSSQHS